MRRAIATLLLAAAAGVAGAACAHRPEVRNDEVSAAMTEADVRALEAGPDAAGEAEPPPSPPPPRDDHTPSRTPAR